MTTEKRELRLNRRYATCCVAERRTIVVKRTCMAPLAMEVS